MSKKTATVETEGERALRYENGYFQAVATVARQAMERGDEYEAAYWGIELETRGALSSSELHRRAKLESRK